MNRLAGFLAKDKRFEFHLDEYIESTRHIGYVNDQLRWFRESIGREHIHWQRVQSFLSYCHQKVPAYAERLNGYHSIDDIPLLDRAALESRQHSYLSQDFSPETAWIRPTSGTTGQPLQVYYAPEFFFTFQLTGIARAAVVAEQYNDELEARDVFAVHLVSKPHLTDRVWGVPDDLRGVTLRLVLDPAVTSSIERVVQIILEKKPAVISAKPELLLAVARTILALKSTQVPGIRFLISSGDHLEQQTRLSIERCFKAPVFNAYGLSELGVVASECELQNGLHLFENENIFEILHSSGELRTAGTGELVVTNTKNMAMPLLRYATGDLAQVTDTPCACGKKGHRLFFHRRKGEGL